MRYLLTSLVCLISVSVFGQAWVKYIDPEISLFTFETVPVSTGGYLYGTGGWGNSTINKIDEFGNDVWNSPTSYGPIYSISETSNQEFLFSCMVLGDSIDATTALIKTDSNGDIVWNNTYSGHPFDAWELSDGYGIIVIDSNDEGFQDIFLRYSKLDSQGTILYSYDIDTDEWSNDFSIHTASITSDEGIIISTYLDGLTKLVKLDNSGNLEFETSIDLGFPTSIKQTSDLGYILSTLQEGNESSTIITKFNQEGVVVWINYPVDMTEPDINNFIVLDVTETSDGGFVYCGFCHIRGGANEEELLVVKTDNEVNEEWNYIFSGYEEQSAFSVNQNSQGEFIVTGYTEHPTNGYYDGLIIKLNTEGTLSSSFTIPTPSNRKLEKVIDILGREVNHTTNQILFHIYDDGSVEKKFIVE